MIEVAEAGVNRADQTRERLMRAAEHLFAAEGIENVSVRAILREAGQKNESALHYHFVSKAGLIEALQAERVQQVIDLRREAVDAATADGREPVVRELCFLMVDAPFRLCSSDRGFRDFISVFGQRLVVGNRPVNAHLQARRDTRLGHINALLKRHLPSLEDRLFEMRMESVTRFAMLAMSRRARSGGSFRGKAAQVFVNDLADTMAGILLAPVSNETREALDR
ncbi:MAG: helix-turn-helix domain-containing protein [Gammaproteobacteria bacterium]|nr:helix-turn-helix domain-containing protein [Gammaproteobacteria bacterium]